jgi:predicted  nucleic acid-binding Zn-ribbon protein
MDGPSRGEFTTLKARVDSLENKIANIMKIIEGINKKMKGV